MQISAKQVKELRDITNVGMMECKRALQETEGDIEAAVKLLRERGMAVAAKKADRAANEGQVDIAISEDGKTGSMIEINCETDFVAKNENFQAFVQSMAVKGLSSNDNGLAAAEKENMAVKISEIGENLVLARNTRYELQGPGAIGRYIHLGGKVGVMVEIGCENEANTASEALTDLGKEVALHIAAANPQSLDRDGVDAELVASEKALFAKQVEGKPENIIDKIIGGKLEKFYSQIVLLEQGFVKDPDISVSDLVAKAGKELGDTLSIRRYVRFQIGG
ncbi:translation elongation factor Ts [Kiritimatiellaeota bacterium B1221]|nr:translation elongation factor Ts [Kiritimatiellaeota bacterium B1221]